jgi:FMN-dependent oxidoreductase (nitrilotriacetate monooxygenase family)
MAATDKGLMHLMTMMLVTPSQHSVSAWRDPLNTPPGFEFSGPEVWQHVARECERGKLDSIFFPDYYAPFDVYGGSTDVTLEEGIQFPTHDPLTVLPLMAGVTERLGLAATMSTTYYHPYMVVRKMSSLDHVTKGRAGWNVVTSFHENEARNFGVEFIPHDERYRRADEFMEVAMKLWQSWDADAVRADPDGMFVDPAKVRPIEHEGEFFSCAGFSPCAPSPQGHPVLFQAGQSPAGRSFAAKWAEATFAIMLNAQQMSAYIAEMGDLAAGHGRDPSQLKYFFGTQPVVGRTAAEAEEKRQAIHERISVEAAMCVISGHTGFDFSSVDPSLPAKEVPNEMPGIQGMWKALLSATESEGEDLSVGEAVRFYARSFLNTSIVGSPKEVAEELITLWEESGATGFLCTPLYYPGAVTDLVDLVIPILQKYKVFRHEYTGATLRDHLSQTKLS